jgi:hypothetical protein
MKKTKSANPNASKGAATVAAVVMSIQMIIILIYITTLLSYNDAFGLGKIANFIGSLANSTLYIIFPLIIAGLVCMSIGIFNYHKYHDKYSAMAFWFSIPSVFGLVTIIGYVGIISLALTAG